MNKAQKRLVSALAAATSVAAAIAPAATVFAATKDDAKALVDNAKKTLAFVDYNQAYAAVVALPAADQAALLAELSPLWDKVATKDVTDVLKTMDALAANKDLKNYYDLYDMIEKTVTLPRNQQYLMGELTSWGRTAVFTADVVAATDAVSKAWTDKTPAALQAAKDAVAKVTNAGSLAWLNNEITNAAKVVPVAFDSVTAKTANSFVVNFTAPVADTTKVVFTVQRSTTPVTVTTTWNADKTQATLTNSANFPEGAYTVAVKNDTTDLGKKDITVSAQKVAKIEITSNKLAVVNKSYTDPVTKNTTTWQEAYASYRVLDQYGNDITTSYLANNITFQTGVANPSDVQVQDGRIHILKTNMNVIQLAQVVVTGYDSTTGVSTSATLATTSSVGTLNNIELKDLVKPNGKDLTDGDTSSVFYINFSATDMSDNATADYQLVKNGLILNTGDVLTTSNSNVIAKVVQDPADDKKAAIQVTVDHNAGLSMDIPVTITAMTYTGKTSSINLTLRKAQAVDTFTLMAPSFDIAVGDAKKEIPFEAYDQNGNRLTKADDVNDSTVTFSTGAMHLERNVDGTAKLTFNPAGLSDGPQIVTAMTKTGKLSTLTLNIQKAVKADTLTLGTLVTNFAFGATQAQDFGYDQGGFTVKDQYGRAMDLTDGSKSVDYKVTATSSDSTIIAVDSVKNAAFAGRNQVLLTAGTKAGSTTVKFDLVEVATSRVIDTKSVTYSVLDNKDIKSYGVDPITAAVYTSVARTATVGTNRDGDFAANPKLYGKTAGGAKVKLAGSPIIGAFVNNSDDFIVTSTASATTPGGFDSTKVAAKKLPDGVTSSKTTVTISFVAADGTIQSTTTDVNSATAAPVATNLTVSADTSYGTVSVDGDTYTVDKTVLDPGKVLARYDQYGSSAGRARVYFRALDQYGKNSQQLAQVALASAKNVGQISIAWDGTITQNSPLNSGDWFVVTATTSNGLTKTIKLVVK